MYSHALYAPLEPYIAFSLVPRSLCMFIQKVHKPAEHHKLSTLRHIYSTGSPLAPHLFDFVYEHISPHVLLASITGTPVSLLSIYRHVPRTAKRSSRTRRNGHLLSVRRNVHRAPGLPRGNTVSAPGHGRRSLHTYRCRSRARQCGRTGLFEALPLHARRLLAPSGVWEARGGRSSTEAIPRCVLL